MRRSRKILLFKNIRKTFAGGSTSRVLSHPIEKLKDHSNYYMHLRREYFDLNHGYLITLYFVLLQARNFLSDLHPCLFIKNWLGHKRRFLILRFRYFLKQSWVWASWQQRDMHQRICCSHAFNYKYWTVW